MSTHDLKVWPDFFPALVNGAKTFEVRKNDRDFKVGDTLVLREYAPGKDEYTGRVVVRRVSYILSDYAFGLRDGFVAMGLQP